MSNRIYQFKIELQEITPTVWRRILVPETYSFWDLHVAIQDAMGWLDYHLHAFQIRRKHSRKATDIGIPDVYGLIEDNEVHAGWEIPIPDYFQDVGASARYEYDFGDSWCHEVVLEGVLLKEKGQKYPRCIDGAQACPPEDCGGVYGYYRMLEVLADPNDDEHDDMLEWLGGRYDPQEFAPRMVKFDNPKNRLKRVLSRG